jgi:hypothetical protein
MIVRPRSGLQPDGPPDRLAGIAYLPLQPSQARRRRPLAFRVAPARRSSTASTSDSARAICAASASARAWTAWA